MCDEVRRYVLGWRSRNAFDKPVPAMAAGSYSPEVTSYVRATDYDALLSRLQAVEARWVPWKPGDALPAHGIYLLTLETFEELRINPVYTKVLSTFTDWRAWGVIAYWSAPLPPPYVAALTSTQEKT